jgi:peptidoglycan/xylan/chitin deacetylase (PgdA/CDA1 family)
LLARLDADPSLDAVYCGWERTAPDGTVLQTVVPGYSGDLFPILAERNAFAIHTCLVRRARVAAAAGFDDSLRIGEDWDLWQRLARSGLRFGHVPEALARYRMRPGSASSDAVALLRSALRRIEQGHSPDPRVAAPAADYRQGLAATRTPVARHMVMIWCAGSMIGRGQDPAPLLEIVGEPPREVLDPAQVAAHLADAIVAIRGLTPSAWPGLWPSVESQIDRFLERLEIHTGRGGTAAAARRALERRVLAAGDWREATRIGSTCGVPLELSGGISDLRLPAAVERVYVRVVQHGGLVGHLELPADGSAVPGYVLSDAIAAEFAWVLLRQLFEETVYPGLRLDGRDGRITVRRGKVRLASGLSRAIKDDPAALHDQIGWTVLLQELCGRPDWSGGAFYNPQVAEPYEPAAVSWTGGAPLHVELSGDLPTIRAGSEDSVAVVPTVGGEPLGVVAVPAVEGGVEAGALRVALLTACGFELCRACVRVGIVEGGGDRSLRHRLREGARLRSGALPREVDLVVARRMPATIGLSPSRRVSFPPASARWVAALGGALGESLASSPGGGQAAGSALYVPEIIPSAPVNGPLPAASSHPREVREGSAEYVRHYFESLFARGADPWRYTTPYEETKYQQTLDLLPDAHFEEALELACAEGHFTARLAPRVGRLTAADISEIAIRRTAERCAGCGNVSCRRIDLAADPIPGRYDLITCSEVLYFMSDRAALAGVAARLRDALHPGGYLLMAHANAVVDDPEAPGFDWDVPFGARVIGETFQALPDLALVKELRTPLYRIHLFRRRADADVRDIPPVERIVLKDQPTRLEPHSAARVLWDGGRPQKYEVVAETSCLPILMYHRVAPEREGGRSRFRVTPEAFEEQMRYLYENGYRTIDLDEWGAATLRRQPLAGNAVLLTFDDGYLDFVAHAWPILKRFGFSATVFLVADAVGSTNLWDAAYGEPVPLMGWEEILRLQGDRIAFGSHSATHPLLTSLTSERVVEEAVRSRLLLEERLGTPVRAFCYPYGAYDPTVSHLIGGCGYLYGLGVHPGLCRLREPPLSMPRVEISGYDRLATFVTKLGSGGAVA